MPFNSLLYTIQSLQSASPWQDTGPQGSPLKQLRFLEVRWEGPVSSTPAFPPPSPHLATTHQHIQPREKLCMKTWLLVSFMRLPKTTPTASHHRSSTPATVSGFYPSLQCLEFHQSRSSKLNAVLYTVDAQNTGPFLECPVLFGDLCLPPRINERKSSITRLPSSTLGCMRQPH